MMKFYVYTSGKAYMINNHKNFINFLCVGLTCNYFVWLKYINTWLSY